MVLSGLTFIVNPLIAIVTLRFDSSHPGHCCRSLPYSQFLRIRRICSHDADFERHGALLVTYFCERGYPLQLLKDTFNQVKSFSRESLLEIKHAGIQGQVEKPEVYAISTFHPTYRDFKGVINDNWDLLAAPSTKMLFESKVVFGNRHPKNLRDLLVSATVKEVTLGPQPKVKKQCPRKNTCKYCPKLDTGGQIIGLHDKRSWRTRIKCDLSK